MAITDSPSSSKEESLIWRNAIQRYYDELRSGGIKGPAIDKNIWNIKSPMDLLEEVKNLESPDSRASRAWLGSLRRLEPCITQSQRLRFCYCLGSWDERKGSSSSLGIDQAYSECEQGVNAGEQI